MIIVREALPADHDGVEIVVTSAMAILRKIYRPGPKAMSARSKLAASLKRLVAVADGEIVGTTQYYCEGDAIRVIGLMVRSDRQRMGVSRALIAHLAAIARNGDKQKLRARTIKETGNVPVFRGLGFIVTDEHPDTLFVSDLFPCLTEVDLERSLVFNEESEQDVTSNV